LLSAAYAERGANRAEREAHARLVVARNNESLASRKAWMRHSTQQIRRCNLIKCPSKCEMNDECEVVVACNDEKNDVKRLASRFAAAT